MYRENDFDTSEQRLRRQIRNAFQQADALPPGAMRTIEDEVLALMEAYFRAPVEKRDQVFEERERKLLNTVMGWRRYLQKRPSNVREG